MFLKEVFERDFFFFFSLQDKQLSHWKAEGSKLQLSPATLRVWGWIRFTHQNVLFYCVDFFFFSSKVHLYCLTVYSLSGHPQTVSNTYTCLNFDCWHGLILLNCTPEPKHIRDVFTAIEHDHQGNTDVLAEESTLVKYFETYFKCLVDTFVE